MASLTHLEVRKGRPFRPFEKAGLFQPIVLQAILQIFIASLPGFRVALVKRIRILIAEIVGSLGRVGSKNTLTRP